MTDEQARQDTSAEAVTESVSPGRMLREGRERLNLTPGQVAERLRLREQIVTDLEQDQFDKYVAGTFTRGYLRAYARLVGVDEGVVLAAYEALGVNDTPQQMQSFSRRTRQQSQDNRLMLVTYVIGAIIIGSAIIFWLQNNNEPEDENARSQEPSVAERMVSAQDVQVDIGVGEDASTTAATRDPIFIDTSLLDSDQQEPAQTQQVEDDHIESQPESIEPAVDQAEQDREQQAIADAALAEQAEQAEQAQQRAEQASAAAETESESSAIPEADLVLVFNGDAWIRVEDATGEAIAFGVKPEGHTSALNGEPPYEVTLGAPENVSLYFQGNQIDLSSYRAGRVARLTLPAVE